MGRLDGRAVIITGSGRNIGRVYAEHLAPLVAFLCSEESEMIVGQDYVVDAGFHFS